MPRKILVCQHVAHEPLGTLNPLLKKSGFRIKYVNFGRHPDLRPEIDGYAGLIVLGGPMNCDEVEKYPFLSHEVKLIRDAIDKKVPVLGICLGSQLMARALGARVRKNPKKEIGWYPLSLTEQGLADPLFKNLVGMEKVFQWHGDTFDIPEGAVHLAASPLCPNQGFRFGDRVYGLQFHLEVDESMIARWLTVPENQQELKVLEEQGEKIDPLVVWEETFRHIPSLHEKGEALFGGWKDLFGKERKVRLPSR